MKSSTNKWRVGFGGKHKVTVFRKRRKEEKSSMLPWATQKILGLSYIARPWLKNLNKHIHKLINKLRKVLQAFNC